MRIITWKATIPAVNKWRNSVLVWWCGVWTLFCFYEKSHFLHSRNIPWTIGSKRITCKLHNQLYECRSDNIIGVNSARAGDRLEGWSGRSPACKLQQRRKSWGGGVKKLPVAPPPFSCTPSFLGRGPTLPPLAVPTLLYPPPPMFGA